MWQHERGREELRSGLRSNLAAACSEKGAREKGPLEPKPDGKATLIASVFSVKRKLTVFLVILAW